MVKISQMPPGLTILEMNIVTILRTLSQLS